MAQHKLAQKKKQSGKSLPSGAQKVHKKKSGAKKRTANRGDSFKVAKNQRKAESQKMDAAITKMINRKNEENARARAAADIRAGKS